MKTKLVMLVMFLIGATVSYGDIVQYVWTGFNIQPPPMTPDGNPDMSPGYAKYWVRRADLPNKYQEGTIWVDGADGRIIKSTVQFIAQPAATTN